MNEEVIKEKLEKIIFECDRHIKRLLSASKKMQNFMPLNKKKYMNLNDEEVEHIDQFLFRFAKLQDAMGQKLFKNILLCLDEEIEGKPFIDILHLMEKIELLEDAKIWRELRNDRNELAHNYEYEPELMSASINRLYEKKDIIIDIYEKIKKQYLLRCKKEKDV